MLTIHIPVSVYPICRVLAGGHIIQNALHHHIAQPLFSYTLLVEARKVVHNREAVKTASDYRKAHSGELEPLSARVILRSNHAKYEA